MIQQNQKILAAIIFSIFTLAFFSLKFCDTALVKSLYKNNQLGVLNAISGSHGAQELDYYLGEAEKKFFGPVKMLLSLGLFTLFSFLYLKDKNPRTFGLAIFVFLIITRFEALFFPVYGGDAITAVFVEAIWLARHSLDYIGLWHQPGYKMGGPKVYFLTIYPAFLAVQMMFLSLKPLFFALNHSLTFAMAAMIIARLKKILESIFDQEIALLISLLVFSYPLFQSQLEMINMEMPTLFFAFMSMYYLVQRKMAQATFMACVAILIKGTGVIACGAVFGTSLLYCIVSKKWSWKELGWGIAAAGFALMIVGITTLVRDDTNNIGYIKLWSGTLNHRPIYHVFLVCTAVFIAFITKVAWDNSRSKKTLSDTLFVEHRTIFVLSIFTAMWFLLYANFSGMVPRYKLLVLPFFLPWVIFCCGIVLRSKKIRVVILFLTIGLLSFSSYGFLEHQPESYNYIELERSLEYRNVLLRDIRLSKTVEEKYSAYTIVAPSVMAQILALPELGYVRKKREVLIYATPAQYEGLKNFAGKGKLKDIKHTLWVGLQDDMSDSLSRHFPFPVAPRDMVLETIACGDKKAYLFLGGYAIDQMWEFKTIGARKMHILKEFQRHGNSSNQLFQPR